MLGHMLATGVKILRIDQSTLVLGVDGSKPRDLKMLNSAGCRDRIKELASEKLGRPIQVQVEAADILSATKEQQATPPLEFQSASSRADNPVGSPPQAAAPVPERSESVAPAAVESLLAPPHKPIKELKANGDLHKTDSDGNNICYTSEVVQKSQVMVTGDPLRKWLENRPELKELVENAKEVFCLDYTQIEARISPL